jgi:hypothetical protein
MEDEIKKKSNYRRKKKKRKDVNVIVKEKHNNWEFKKFNRFKI